jgi:hypothetical protein
MPQAIQVEVEMPGDLARFGLPKGVASRPRALLDKQDQGQTLTAAEKREVEGLMDLAELLSLLRLRSERLRRRTAWADGCSNPLAPAGCAGRAGCRHQPWWTGDR